MLVEVVGKISPSLSQPNEPLKKLENSNLALHVGNNVIVDASSVHDFCQDVTLDCELCMKKHISKVAGVCYFHLRRLKTIRRLLGEKTTALWLWLLSVVTLTTATPFSPGFQSRVPSFGMELSAAISTRHS
jgi:hypothetical protein